MLRVLLIEDNPGDAEIVRHRFRGVRGGPWQVETAESLEEGLTAYQADHYDLVLLDLNLPDSSGLETIDAFRAQATEAPLVVLTGTDDLDVAVDAIRRGADDYMVKGELSSEQLTRTLRYAVERRRMIVSLDKERRTVATLQDVGAALASELEREPLVQKITDLATRLVGASFGAFFQTVSSSEGAALSLYALSGARRADLERLGLPRATSLLGPTIRAEGVVRIDDVRLDPRYGRMGPHHGMPPGHLPVVSYLAVPVLLRSGKPVGGLFFGHPERAKFTPEHEALAVGVAAWASVAMDNAHLYEEALHATRSRENLLQVVSHDLRNHVNTMQMGLHLLRHSLPPEGVKRIEAVERATSTMRRMLEDLVDLAAIEKGVLSVTPALVDARNVLEEAHALLAPSIDRKGIALDWQSGESGVMVWADGERIQQILGNLVGNAVKFTRSGGRIGVTTVARDAELEVAVQDTGPGIPGEDQARIFDRFYRGARPSGQGAGLGLAIARALVEAHRGRIWVESRVGVGTVMRFVLPRTAPGGV
ncbi:MAG: ATP-binding protein [Myxococcota bacterium]|nr:ATP-binding protein [Myxococcota bacterium]